MLFLSYSAAACFYFIVNFVDYNNIRVHYRAHLESLLSTQDLEQAR